ncbi:MAG TPA: DUF5691 domain-containing protein [Acidimicrobiales bacterium]|nr:DUF5691 domain-containing protein [Acidimicrobiales bacterium]
MTVTSSPSGALSTSALWDRLVSVALVGTERKPLPADVVAAVAALVDDPARPDGAEAAGTAAAERRPVDVEVEVLTAAAIVAAHQRVGLVPLHGDDAPPGAGPDDDRPEVSSTAAQLLSLLLEGHVRVLGGPVGLVEEWLRRCPAAGRRPPARLLPALLDHATRVPSLRSSVVATGGAPLAWLGRHNPAWSWAAETETETDRPSVPADDDEVWRIGEPAARLALLTARRATDPAAARHLAEETWSGESAKDRARILEVMRTGLHPDDEAFLEASLDDRAVSVRAVAADLLARLPGSALAARMADRVRPLVGRGQPGLVGRLRRRLEIALPEAIDAAARRDGIVDAGAPPATGKRTWWLIQLVGATPLTFWTDELGLSPAAAVRQATPVFEGKRPHTGGFPSKTPDLVQGWVRAAGRHGDPVWCRELMRVAPEPRLLAALPAEQAHDLLPVALEHAAEPALAGLLAATPGPWPVLLSQWVVQRLRAGKDAGSVDRALTALAAAGDVGIIPDLERWIDDLRVHDRRRATLPHVIHALSIRHTIAQELS